MKIEISRDSIETLAEYARVPIAFTVDRAFDVAEGKGGFASSERKVEPPYLKDYDSIGGGPMKWPSLFDISDWALFAARAEGLRAGGAAVACKTPNLEMLEGRMDLAVLWDLRVAYNTRGQGVGSALFVAAQAWARSQGYRQLKIETQNTNVPACRFYARQGCVLKVARPFAYPEFPDEIQLFWYKDF